MAAGRSKSKMTSGLGKALVKEKRRERKGSGKGDVWLHTSELSDGYEWGRLNLRSITEENSLEEFLRTAELAGTEFTAEKQNISVVHERYTGLPNSSEKREIERAQQLCIQDLTIPRRPLWDASTTPEQLELSERDAFLKWRRHLAALEEKENILLTPFEKNLEFWRQLWRVIERSDIVVQIVDARSPLLFRCKDLEKYVTEIGPDKVNMLLMNKSDLLTNEQRAMWLEYFMRNSDFNGTAVAFWSAKIATDIEEESDLTEGGSDLTTEGGSDLTTEGGSDLTTEGGSDLTEGGSDLTEGRSDLTTEGGSDLTTEEGSYLTEGGSDLTTEGSPAVKENEITKLCTSDLLSIDALLQLFRNLSPSISTERPVTVGLVGYPNVGKSSTINALLQVKKVPVSATPGRTKHFQTLYVSDDIILCDCPGLVFPNFISTKAEMICNGILPIDQMRDHVPPVSMVCHKVPRPLLESYYGICIPSPLEGEDPLRPPLAHELLSAYGYSRGFMTAHGQPDQSRSARYILKDYVNGKILYCEPPPTVDPKQFNEMRLETKPERKESEMLPVKTDTPQFDATFFKQREGIVHTKRPSTGATAREGGNKEWKKHHNYKKKEKTRRIVGDQTPYNYF